MRVVVLEQGDWPDYSKARADNPDFELTMGRYWSGNPNRRQAAADYLIDDTDSDISAVLYNAVGGGTVIYAAHWQRNMPSDFRVRSLDGVGHMHVHVERHGHASYPWRAASCESQIHRLAGATKLR